MDYQFEYKGNVYECIGEDRDFHICNFNYCIEIQDWVTLKNRITNQLMWHPTDLVEILERDITMQSFDVTSNEKHTFW